MTATEYRGYTIEAEHVFTFSNFTTRYDFLISKDEYATRILYADMDDAKDWVNMKLDGKSEWEIKLPDGVIQAYEFISDAILDAVRLNATPLFEIEAI
jgi:hypothetical protein